MLGRVALPKVVEGQLAAESLGYIPHRRRILANVVAFVPAMFYAYGDALCSRCERFTPSTIEDDLRSTSSAGGS